MNKIRWIAACVLMTFLPRGVFAGSVPYIPATASPFATALTVATETPVMLYASRLSSSPRNFTGNVAENMMRFFSTAARLQVKFGTRLIRERYRSSPGER